jgi:hypothetical protein
MGVYPAILMIYRENLDEKSKFEKKSAKVGNVAHVISTTRTIVIIQSFFHSAFCLREFGGREGRGTIREKVNIHWIF